MTAYEDSGGFLPPLLSPPPSSHASTTGGPLPQPRHSPLKAGGNKESSFISSIDQRILHITRSFANRQTGIEQDSTQGRSFKGYSTFKEAGSDMSRVIDLVWASGTPTLQTPYLIRLATLILNFIPAFPAAPRSMFRVISKLDYAFSSLLQGQDLDSGDTLPGFVPGRGLSSTEKVRIKSLVERTRITVVQAMNTKDFEVTDGDDEDMEVTEMENDMPYDVDDVGGEDDMEIARIYDKTLLELGDTIGGPEIGIACE